MCFEYAEITYLTLYRSLSSDVVCFNFIKKKNTNLKYDFVMFYTICYVINLKVHSDWRGEKIPRGRKV